MATKTNPLDAFASTWSNLSADFRIPALPKLSEAVSKGGFREGLANHEAAMEQWRANLERTIVERLQAIPTPPATAVTATTSTASSSGASPGAVAAISDALAAHIAADIVHGTVSPVVGESDVQNLDGKTIGSNQPGFGFFKAAVNSNFIQSGDVLDIGPMSNLILVGGLTIDGAITVEGTLLLL